MNHIRLSRLRGTAALRDLVTETRIHAKQLVLPVFVREGLAEPNPISSMPGVFQHTLDSVKSLVVRAAELGIGGVMLFGIPSIEKLDMQGSQAFQPNGILNQATQVVLKEVGKDLVIQTDLCLDEFTNHGHCGILNAAGKIDNIATLKIYAKIALAQAATGSQLLGLSGMVDGQVAYVREALDTNGFSEVAILAYSAKYASNFYAPFREAVNSQLLGDRKTYQIDPPNAKSGVRQAEIDVAAGADIVMVKPALPYLDILTQVVAKVSVPVWAYQVSGEYAQVVAAAEKGWIDKAAAIHESALAVFRAGATGLITYFALDLAELLLYQ